MKLQELPHLVPGADVRVRSHGGKFMVEVRAPGAVGAGEHRNLEQATRLALRELGIAPP